MTIASSPSADPTVYSAEVRAWLHDVLKDLNQHSMASRQWTAEAWVDPIMRDIDHAIAGTSSPLKDVQGIVCAVIFMRSTVTHGIDLGVTYLVHLCEFAYTPAQLYGFIQSVASLLWAEPSDLQSPIKTHGVLGCGNSQVYRVDLANGRRYAIKRFDSPYLYAFFIHVFALSSLRGVRGVQQLVAATIDDELKEAHLVSDVYPYSFKDFLDRFGGNTDRLVVAALQLLDAMASAHAREVVHRDIKPANLMFDSEWRLVVIDWDSAAMFQPTSTGSTMSTNPVTTYPYRAPEVFMGGKYTFNVDSWSIGCVLAEMFLDGTRLFGGATEKEVRRNIMSMHHVRVAIAAIRKRSTVMAEAIEALLQPDPKFRCSPSEAVHMIFYHQK